MDLYHNRMSVCSQKVRLVMAQKNIKAVEHHLDLGAGDSHAPEYLRLNSNGVVPTLIDDGNVIIESTIICEYLEEAYPKLSLAPSNPVDRAKMRVWTLVPDTGLHTWCSTISFAIAWRHENRETQMAQWSPQKRAARMEAVRLGLAAPNVGPHLAGQLGVLRRMAAALEKTEWLAGDMFSLADTSILPYVCRLEDLALEWIWEENRALSPIADWLRRCRQQPGFAGISNYYDEEQRKKARMRGSEERSAVKELIKSFAEEAH